MKHVLTGIAVLGLLAGSLSAQSSLTTLSTVVNPANGHTYHLLDQSDWTTAEACAVTMGGHLVTVDNIAENTFLTSNFSQFGAVTRHLWIGYTDGAVEGTWGWSSASGNTFTNWWIAGGSPNNSFANDPVNGEDFACIYPTGEWEDLHNAATSFWFPVMNGVVEVEGIGTAFCFGDGTGTACPCGNNGAADSGCVNSSGAGAILSADGSASVTADDLTFKVTNGPASVPGIVFAGAQQVNGGAGSLFGDGLLCAGGSINRLTVSFLDGSGSATWGPGLAPLGGWASGDTRYLQAWFREVNGPCSSLFNTSQALAITFQL